MLSRRGPGPRGCGSLGIGSLLRGQERGEATCAQAGAAGTYSEGGGLVLAHTTDLRRPFLCQPCPALQLLSASEIPRERRIIVGLSPLNLPKKPEGFMEHVRAASSGPSFSSPAHAARKWAHLKAPVLRWRLCQQSGTRPLRGSPEQTAAVPRQLRDRSWLQGQEVRCHGDSSPDAPQLLVRGVRSLWEPGRQTRAVFGRIGTRKSTAFRWR